MLKWLAVLVLAVVMSVGVGCTPPPTLISPYAKKTQSPLITVPASKATTKQSTITSWQIFPYHNGTTTGFTLMGLDQHQKMVRAARVFKVAGKTSTAPTTIAFAPLYPKAKGRIRVLDNGLYGQTTLSQKNFTKYFKWMRSDLAHHLNNNNTKSSKSLTNGMRALTCLKTPSQQMGLVRHQARLCALAVHSMVTTTTTTTAKKSTSLTTKMLHILGDDDDDDSGSSGDDDSGGGGDDDSGSVDTSSDDNGSDNVVDTTAGDEQPATDPEPDTQNADQTDGTAEEQQAADQSADFTPAPDAEGQNAEGPTDDSTFQPAGDVSQNAEGPTDPGTDPTAGTVPDPADQTADPNLGDVGQNAEGPTADATGDVSQNAEGPTTDATQPPAEPNAEIASGVADTTAKAADDPSQALPTEADKTAADTADAKTLGADQKTADCSNCASNMKQTELDQVANAVNTRAPDFYQISLSGSAFGANGELTLAVAKDGTIYGSVGGGFSGGSIIPQAGASAQVGYMISGKADDNFMTGLTNGSSVTGGFVTGSRQSNDSGTAYTMGISTPGASLNTGKSYGFNLGSVSAITNATNNAMANGALMGMY